MKKRRKLLWQLYPTYLLTIIPALIAISLYATHEIRTSILEEIASDLTARATLVKTIVSTEQELISRERIQAVCQEMGSKTATRYTVILPDGRVIGDSQKDPERMDDHSDRPEIQAALAGEIGRSTRHSDSLDQEMMYVAIPVRFDDEPAAVIRSSVPVTIIDATVGRINRQIAIAGLVVALLAAFVSLFVAYRVGRPLNRMIAGARRFADGELDYRLSAPDIEETASLAESLNQMAAQLDERMRLVTRQRNELEAMLTSMVEAVLVVDLEGRIIRTNRASRAVFHLDVTDGEDRTIREAIHNADLNRFVTRIISGEAPLEGEIVLHRDEEIILHTHATTLVDATGQQIGVLLVMHDVTRLKKLERVRQDFVANVSHELKTPITSIKGFVETLKDGAIDEPEHSRRFLDIIVRHSDRLDAIIEDLLSLSRIEQQNESGQIAVESMSVSGVIDSALAIVASKARKRSIELTPDCDPDLRADLNGPLIEQALVNLVDNAIKYSEPGAKVSVRVVSHEAEIVIEVDDDGPGISREHKGRLFERFYRIDRARSRDAGGTGLGLAIVKHIASAHAGRVSVDSRPGSGSTFRIHIPSND